MSDSRDPMDGSPIGSAFLGFPQKEYWSGLPFPSPRDLPNPGIEPGSPSLPANTLPSEPPGKPHGKREKDKVTLRKMIRKSTFLTVLEALTNLKFLPYTSYVTSVKAPMCFTSLHIQKPKPCKRFHACSKVNTGYFPSNFSYFQEDSVKYKEMKLMLSIHTKVNI